MERFNLGINYGAATFKARGVEQTAYLMMVRNLKVGWEAGQEKTGAKYGP